MRRLLKLSGHTPSSGTGEVTVFLAEAPDAEPDGGAGSDPGRVLLYPDGSVLANVEVYDVWQRQVYALLRKAAERGQVLSCAGSSSAARQVPELLSPCFV